MRNTCTKRSHAQKDRRCTPDWPTCTVVKGRGGTTPVLDRIKISICLIYSCTTMFGCQLVTVYKDRPCTTTMYRHVRHVLAGFDLPCPPSCTRLYSNDVQNECTNGYPSQVDAGRVRQVVQDHRQNRQMQKQVQNNDHQQQRTLPNVRQQRNTNTARASSRPPVRCLPGTAIYHVP